LDDNERAQYKAEYPQEEQTMTSLTERLRAEGMEKGMAQGMEQGMTQGERTVLIRQLQRRFGPLDAQSLNRLEAANQQQLELWAERVLEADSLADFFQEH
jgi:flagellar biosynthesis/type III secretory pathway protein FliH